MPNVKLFVDQEKYPAAREGLAALLPGLRAMLCAALEVDPAACQFAVIPVLGLPDQPPVNTELYLLPRSNRTPEVLQRAAAEVHRMVMAATGLHTAVRIAALDPQGYIARK